MCLAKCTHVVPNISFFSILSVAIMPKVLCVGCKWEFEDLCRFSYHKWHCARHIDADIAQHFEQLENREGNLNPIQVNSGGENIYKGQQGLLNTAGGVDDDTNMGMPVRLIVVLLPPDTGSILSP